ncbi:MAG: hypothetical protein ACOC0X_02390 [Halobacteriota archaeon]
MDLRSIGLATAAGIAAFLLVTVAVTEAASATIEFSLFVGLPAGVIAGIAAMASVYVGLNRGQRGRAVAAAAGAFGLGFLLATGIGLLLGWGVLVAMGLGVAGGGIGAVIGWRR